MKVTFVKLQNLLRGTSWMHIYFSFTVIRISQENMLNFGDHFEGFYYILDFL